ncbi:hypothetical protein Tco_1022979 [Tanacetum coccineum]
MTTLKFADTHNMVAFLSKPAESKGFEQIVDFLNAHPIKHALTINPIIYTLCIEQFWSTVKAKTVNGEVQLQALVDGKKIIITESTVRRDLQLEDAKGVDCLPNATIFEQLTLMGPKTTAWNKFSSTMASAVICLATNQKFNFSKFIFESMVKNLDNVGKFLMYPRFVQVFLDKQLEGMSNHNKIYVTPSYTKKIFGNTKKISGRETPLFPTMVVHNKKEMGEGSAIPTDPHHTPTFIQPSPQPQKTQKPRRPKKKDTQVPQSSVPSDNVVDEAVYKELDDSLARAATIASSLEAEQDSGNIDKTQSKATPNEPSSQGTSSGGGPSGEDCLKLKELIELCTNLQQRVLDLETTKITQANEIASLKRRVKKLEKKTDKNLITEKVIQSCLSTRVLQQSGAAKTTTEVQDKGKRKMIEPKPVKKMSKKINSGDDIQAKIKADHELAQRLQAEEQEELSKVDEDKDTTELQSLMEVIPDEEEVAIDDVPLATKPPTIVDWKIHKKERTTTLK